MMCPNCSVELKMSERQGVEIDYCPQCRGVWLDRGELDKIIEKSQSVSPRHRDGRGWDDDHDDDSRRRKVGWGWNDDDDDDDDDRGRFRGKRRKSKSILDDLFDFG